MLNAKRIYRIFRQNSRGFTLIEVLVAIVLLGIIGIAFFGGLSTASSALLLADERATAESLARSRMEYVKNQDYDANEPQSYEQGYVPVTGYPGYEIKVDAEPLRNPDDGIQRITVTVKHNNKPIITSGNYTLEDYKVDR